MLIAEELLLLVTDDHAGTKVRITYPEILTGAALLADLILSGCVRISGQGEITRPGRVVPNPQVSVPNHPVFSLAMSSVAARPGGWRPGGLVTKLSKRSVVHCVYTGLARAEIVGRQDKEFLGLFSWQTWPTVTPGYEFSSRQRLLDVLLRGAPADARRASIIAVLDASRAVGKVMLAGYAYDRALVRQRVKELRRQFWLAELVRGAARSAIGSQSA